MFYLPLSLNQSATVHATLESTLIGNRYNIPLAIPFGINHGFDSANDEELINQEFDHVISDSPIRSQESDERASIFATCDKLPASSPTASGNDGNVPSNVIDNNLNTRWSNLGTGSWIQLDLGSKKSICSVDIAWYLGNQRQNNFILSVSDDGTTFTQKHLGTSSGTTTSPEKYNIPSGTEGRYVRVTVNGNTQNEWASITEIAVFGSSSSGEDSLLPIDNPGPMYHKWQNTAGTTTSWSSYQSLDGTLKSNPAVAMNTDGRLETFAVGGNNQLYHRWQNSPGSSSWSSWTSLEGTLKSNPAVAMNADGRLQVFAVGSDNALWHRWQISAGSSNSWSAWSSLGGTIASTPAVQANSDGRLEVFVVGANNQLYHKWQTSPGSSSWSAYHSLGGTIEGDPLELGLCSHLKNLVMHSKHRL